jgi:hypothetical protein
MKNVNCSEMGENLTDLWLFFKVKGQGYYWGVCDDTELSGPG